jgi:hypothetical protein
MFCTEWLLACSSRVVYERLPDNQVFYVLPVESILEKMPVVPTGTIPYCMEDFVGAAFDTREGAGDGKVVVYQHVGLELVARTRREMNNLSLLFCIF